MATYIQNNLKKIGVIMDIELVEQRISNQMMKRKEFDAILTILYNEENELHLIKKYFGENSSLGYNNPLLNKLLDEIEITGDKTKIDSLYKETFSIFKQDIPATFILPKVETHIVSKRIKGLNNLYKADPVWFLESLWIE